MCLGPRWSAGSGVLIWLPVACYAEPVDPQLAAIAAAWKERQSKARALRYEMNGKWVIFPAEGGSPFGPPGKTPDSRRIERVMLIDWPRGAFRKETKEQTSDGFDSWLQVFDGKVIKARRRLLSPNGELQPGFREKVGIGRGSFAHATFSADYWPIFFAAGIVPTSVTDEYFPGHLTFPAQPDMLSARGQVRVDGRACVVLATFPTGAD